MSVPYLAQVLSSELVTPVDLTSKEISKRRIWEPDVFRIHFGRRDFRDPNDPVTFHVAEPSNAQPHVSRRHATLVLEHIPHRLSRRWRALLRDGYVDESSGLSHPSTNGTFINNIRCGHESSWPLRDGDFISLGGRSSESGAVCFRIQMNNPEPPPGGHFALQEAWREEKRISLDGDVSSSGEEDFDPVDEQAVLAERQLRRSTSAPHSSSLEPQNFHLDCSPKETKKSKRVHTPESAREEESVHDFDSPTHVTTSGTTLGVPVAKETCTSTRDDGDDDDERSVRAPHGASSPAESVFDYDLTPSQRSPIKHGGHLVAAARHEEEQHSETHHRQQQQQQQQQHQQQQKRGENPADPVSQVESIHEYESSLPTTAPSQGDPAAAVSNLVFVRPRNNSPSGVTLSPPPPLHPLLPAFSAPATPPAPPRPHSQEPTPASSTSKPHPQFPFHFTPRLETHTCARAAVEEASKVATRTPPQSAPQPQPVRRASPSCRAPQVPPDLTMSFSRKRERSSSGGGDCSTTHTGKAHASSNGSSSVSEGVVGCRGSTLGEDNPESPLTEQSSFFDEATPVIRLDASPPQRPPAGMTPPPPRPPEALAGRGGGLSESAHCSGGGGGGAAAAAGGAGLQGDGGIEEGRDVSLSCASILEASSSTQDVSQVLAREDGSFSSSVGSTSARRRSRRGALATQDALEDSVGYDHDDDDDDDDSACNHWNDDSFQSSQPFSQATLHTSNDEVSEGGHPERQQHRQRRWNPDEPPFRSALRVPSTSVVCGVPPGAAIASVDNSHNGTVNTTALPLPTPASVCGFDSVALEAMRSAVRAARERQVAGGGVLSAAMPLFRAWLGA